MLIGVPREIKNHEYRVGMAPASVREAIKHGHQVMVEARAGDGIGVSDLARGDHAGHLRSGRACYAHRPGDRVARGVTSTLACRPETL